MFALALILLPFTLMILMGITPSTDMLTSEDC